MSMIKKISVLGLLGMMTGLAWADPVAVVSSKSALATASKEEIASLFLGKTTSIGGVAMSPIGLKEGQAVRDAFYQKFAGKSADQAKAIIAKQVFTGKMQPMKEVPSDNEVKSLLNNDTNLVGMIDSGSLDSSVKVISK